MPFSKCQKEGSIKRTEFYTIDHYMNGKDFMDLVVLLDMGHGCRLLLKMYYIISFHFEKSNCWVSCRALICRSTAFFEAARRFWLFKSVSNGPTWIRNILILIASWTSAIRLRYMLESPAGSNWINDSRFLNWCFNLKHVTLVQSVGNP